MKRANPAAPILRRASELLIEQARELEQAHSVNGVGRLFPNRSIGARRRELRALAHRLKQLSAAFGRSALATGKRPVLKVR
jgi:hypothetical protein